METIKEKIRQHLLNVPEDTAKNITAAIGMNDYPSEVIAALGEMRTNAEIECDKKKGKGKEFFYWLINVKQDVTLADEGDMPTDKECCNAAKVMATTAGQEISKLNEELMRLRDENQRLATESAERIIRIKKLEADQSYRESVIAELNEKLSNATAQITSLSDQLMSDDAAVDVKDAAKGYLLCAPKRKPLKLTNPKSAVERAKSAAKTVGRCDVFALVPIGSAVRKKINSVEFKERMA